MGDDFKYCNTHEPPPTLWRRKALLLQLLTKSGIIVAEFNQTLSKNSKWTDLVADYKISFLNSIIFSFRQQLAEHVTEFWTQWKMFFMEMLLVVVNFPPGIFISLSLSTLNLSFYQRNVFSNMVVNLAFWWFSRESFTPIKAVDVLQLWVTVVCLWDKWTEPGAPKIAPPTSQLYCL